LEPPQKAGRFRRIETFEYQRIDDLRVGDRVKVEGGQLHRV
jgi:outer membrane lipoprotein SlyB